MTDGPIRLVTCVGVGSDLPLLPHFLDHYAALGVAPADTVVILNADAPDHPALAEARAILDARGVATPEIWIAPYTSETMWAERRRAQRVRCAPGDWVLSADVDEFQRWPAPLREVLGTAEGFGADCVQGVMIDRLAPGGRLAPVRPEPGILEQFPIRAEVAIAIGGRSAAHGRGGTVKVMAARGRILPGRGGHRPLPEPRARQLLLYPLGDWREIERPAFRFAVPLQVDHVHWTDTLPERLRRRIATPGVSPAGAAYGARQLAHLERHGGIDLGAVSLAPEGTADWPARLAALRRMGRRKRMLGTARGLLRRAIGRGGGA